MGRAGCHLHVHAPGPRANGHELPCWHGRPDLANRTLVSVLELQARPRLPDRALAPHPRMVHRSVRQRAGCGFVVRATTVANPVGGIGRIAGHARRVSHVPR